jgi:hypothetical protein
LPALTCWGLTYFPIPLGGRKKHPRIESMALYKKKKEFTTEHIFTFYDRSDASSVLHVRDGLQQTNGGKKKEEEIWYRKKEKRKTCRQNTKEAEKRRE